MVGTGIIEGVGVGSGIRQLQAGYVPVHALQNGAQSPALQALGDGAGGHKPSI